MCNSYSFTRDHKKIMERLGATLPVSYTPADRIAPTDTGLVITADKPCEIQTMHFGLVPYWAKSESSKSMNARAETILEKPTFKPLMLQHKRCLVLSDGYFEWKKVGKEKIPYRIEVKGRDNFAFAGLWSRWMGYNNEPYDSYCIVTTEPGSKLGEIHDRMPVILKPEEEKIWLSREVPIADLLALLDTYPDEDLVITELQKKEKTEISKRKIDKSDDWILPF